MKLFPLAAGAVAIALFASQAVAQAPAPFQASPEKIRAHVAFLASDLLEGREPGSKGYDIAASYVASQFAQLGLKPAGKEGTYFQTVPLVAFRPVDQGAYVVRTKDGVATPLVFGEDVLIGRNAGPKDHTVSAPLVFAGWGVVAPEKKHDDYKGLNVKGKIVVVLSGGPPGFQTEERAYYGNARTKREAAEKAGAIGVIFVSTPKDEARRPFAEGKRTWQAWSMTWRGPDGAAYDPAPGAPGLGGVSVQGAAKLFAGAPKTFAEVAAVADSAKGTVPRFALATSLDVALRAEVKTIQSANVAGLIEGSDPKLKGEVIVLSAHLDHIGITAPLNGDEINNGALDNAGGIAIDMVEDAGFTCVEAVDADQAIAILESRSDIALLFTDIQMPGQMDGLGLAHAVHERWPPIKIILVSGQLKLTKTDIPADSHFFAKPLAAAAMIAEIRTMIGHA